MFSVIPLRREAKMKMAGLLPLKVNPFTYKAKNQCVYLFSLPGQSPEELMHYPRRRRWCPHLRISFFKARIFQTV